MWPRQRAPAATARGEAGITGWAQINGRTSLPWPDRIELDVWYVEHRSLRLDLRILARTARILAHFSPRLPEIARAALIRTAAPEPPWWKMGLLAGGTWLATGAALGALLVLVLQSV